MNLNLCITLLALCGAGCGSHAASPNMRDVYDELDDMFFITHPTQDDIDRRNELNDISDDARKWCHCENLRGTLREKYPEWDDSICDIPRHDYANISIDGITPSGVMCGVYCGSRKNTVEDQAAYDLISKVMRNAKKTGQACRRWTGDGYNFDAIVDEYHVTIFEFDSYNRIDCTISKIDRGIKTDIYRYQGDGTRSWIYGNRKGERLYNDFDMATSVLSKLV